MSNRKSTRAAQGSGTIRQRKNGKWEARYTVGRDPGTGKQIQKSVYGDTQAEVRKKLAQATNSIDEGIYTEPSRLTVGAWLGIWLSEYVENTVKPSTFYSYRKQCQNHIKPSLGAVRLATLNAHMIQKFYNDLHRGNGSKNKIIDKDESNNGNGDKPGLSPKTVKNIHGIFHKALKQAVTLGYIKYNPSEACTLPRVTKKEIKPLEESGISIFLEAVAGHKFETVFLLSLFTGMRQGEVLGLVWDCVDFDKGTILVNKQLVRDRDKEQYYLASLKNDGSRTITAAPFVMEALRKHKEQQNEKRLLLGEAWDNPDNLVFTNDLAKPLSHSTVYKSFKSVVNSLGLSTTRFHDLRHSYAVAALQSGDDVKTAQENLGHYTAAFTLDVYGHVSEKMKQESANRMEKFIQGVRGIS
jgi:integrase